MLMPQKSSIGWAIVNPRVVSSSPDQGAKPFKHLDASVSTNMAYPLPSVGTFVAMLFHNRAQVAFVRRIGGFTAGALERSSPKALTKLAA
jgi:hypothetical protein